MQKKKKYLKCKEYTDIIEGHAVVLAIHYNNSVNNHTSLDDLRLMLNTNLQNNTSKKSTVTLQMVKNSLIKIALKNTKFSNFSYVFEGPTLLLYTKDTSINTCKKIISWYTEHKHVENLGGIFNNTLISRNDFDRFIELPEDTGLLHRDTIVTLNNPMKELIAILMRTIINVPHILSIREEQFGSEKTL